MFGDGQRGESARPGAPTGERQLSAFAIRCQTDQRGDGDSLRTGDRKIKVVRQRLLLKGIVEVGEGLLGFVFERFFDVALGQLAAEPGAQRLVRKQAIQSGPLNEP